VAVTNSITYIADRIFTGQEWLEGHAILVEENLIKDVMLSSSLPANIPKKVFFGLFYCSCLY
jgi:N-acetylglucosamine-6-phosphate deacetylase